MRKIIAFLFLLMIPFMSTSEETPNVRGQEEGPHIPICFGMAGPCVPGQG